MHLHWSLLLIGWPVLAALAAWLASLASADPVATLVRGPSLQRLSTHSVGIGWKTDVPADCGLRIRPVNGSARTVEGGAGTECAIDVDALDPGTSYAYTPLADGVPLDDEAVFHTDDPARPFTFLVVGDSGSGGAKQYAVRDRMLATPADFIVHTGDMIYEDGAPEDFDRKFFLPYRALLRSVPFWPTLGNHDVHLDAGAAWYDAFRTPANNAAGDEGYYSFDFGNAHVAVIDSNRTLAVGSPQRDFLEQDMAATTATWKFLAFHHTIYSTGLQHGSDLNRRATIRPIVDQYAIDVVLMGHDHIYERTIPLRDDVQVAPEAGTTYVTTGGGGFSLHQVGSSSSFTQTVEASFHFVRIAVDGGHLLAQMIREDGSIGDTFTITKGGVPAVPTCGDGMVNDAVEQCDGLDRAACVGPCAVDCTCVPVCGDQRVNRAEEACDGDDAASCPGLCRSDCTCDDGTHVLELEASADTVVKPGAEASFDHGALTSLAVDAGPLSVAYLKFDLSDIDRAVVRATLSLYTTNPSFDGGTVYPVRDAGWVEGTANPPSPDGPGLKWTEVDNGDDVLNDEDTSAYAPRLDRRLGALVSVAATRATVDVTPAFQDGPKLYSIAVMNDARDGAAYASREAADPTLHPRLRLEVSDQPAITTTTSTTSTSSTSTSTTTTTTTLAPVELCSGGIDEDGDDLTDCADPDCASAGNCVGGCGGGAEWGALACRFDALATQVDARLAPRRFRTVLAAKLNRAATARASAEERCTAGQERRARSALRAAMRALSAFRRRLDSEAGRQAIVDADRAAWRALATQMRVDLETLRAALDCRV